MTSDKPKTKPPVSSDQPKNGSDQSDYISQNNTQLPLEAIAAGKAAEEAANRVAEKENMFQVIGDYLLLYGSDEAIWCGSELDGFVAAVACAPKTIMPTTWIPLIWGGEKHAPNWEDEQELSRFSSALFVYYNIVKQDFQARSYEPVFQESDGPEDLLVAEEWCNGFLRGIDLWEELSADNMAQLERCLHPIHHFSTREGTSTLESKTTAQMLELQAGIQSRLEALYQHLFKPVKVGRNDPCSCGSGKKYKKCCGLH